VTTDEVDFDLTASIQRVAELAIRELEMMLREASPAIKQRLLTTMFAKMLPLLTTDASAGTDDLRTAMTELFDAVRAEALGGEDARQAVQERLDEDTP